MRLTRIPAAELRKDPGAAVRRDQGAGLLPRPARRLRRRRHRCAGQDDHRRARRLDRGRRHRGGDRRQPHARARPCASISRPTATPMPPASTTIRPRAPRSRRSWPGPGCAQVSPEAMTEITALSRALDPGRFPPDHRKALALQAERPHAGLARRCRCLRARLDRGRDRRRAARHRRGPFRPNSARCCTGSRRRARCRSPCASRRHGISAPCTSPPATPKGPPRASPARRVHFKSRDRMIRQAQNWGAARLEQALEMLIDTDLQLRSSSPTPQHGADGAHADPARLHAARLSRGLPAICTQRSESRQRRRDMYTHHRNDLLARLSRALDAGRAGRARTST